MYYGYPIGCGVAFFLAAPGDFFVRPGRAVGPVFSFIFTANYTRRNDYSIWLRQKAGAGWITWSLFWPAGNQDSCHRHQCFCDIISYTVGFQNDTIPAFSDLLFFMVRSLAINTQISTPQHL